LINGTITAQIPQVREDFSPVFDKVADIMERAIKLNFTVGGRPPASGYFDDVRGVIPWLPTKIRGKRVGGTPLVASGRFAGSVEGDSGEDYAEVSAGGNFSDPRIPFVHQLGTLTAGRNRNVRIPARPYMILTDHDMSEIADTIMDEFIITKNYGG